MSCNNSAVNPSICVQGVGGIGSRTSITVTQNTHGFSLGNAIRWNSGVDGNVAQYVQAKADSPYNAEVVGVVTEVISANAFEVTLSGVVDMTNFFGTEGSIPEGATADDVFFLSSATAGMMDITRPTQPGFVAKPVITRLAEDTDGNIFGSVTNYVGAVNGGSAVSSTGQIVPAGVVQPFAGFVTKIPAGWALCDGDGLVTDGIPGIPRSTYSEYYDTVGKQFGWIEKLTLANTLGVNVGGYLTQSYFDGGLNVTVIGKVRAISGSDVYVEQSIRDSLFVPNTSITNTNFTTQEESDGTLGGSDQAEYSQPRDDNTYYSFRTTQNVSKYDANGNDPGSVPSAVNTANANYAALTPDLRNAFVMGTPTNKFAGASGGNNTNSLILGDVSNGSNQLSTGGDGGIYSKVSNLPNYVTMNYIIRIDPSATAVVIGNLELDGTLTVNRLKVSSMPNTGSGESTELTKSGSDVRID